MFEGWDEINPYDYRINEDLSFTVTFEMSEIYTSPQYGNRQTAERMATLWIVDEIARLKEA